MNILLTILICNIYFANLWNDGYHIDLFYVQIILLGPNIIRDELLLTMPIFNFWQARCQVPIPFLVNSKKGQQNLASGLSLKSHGPPNPHHPPRCTARGRTWCSIPVHHVHCSSHNIITEKVLRVWVSLVGKPESSWFQKRSPKTLSWEITSGIVLAKMMRSLFESFGFLDLHKKQTRQDCFF